MVDLDKIYYIFNRVIVYGGRKTRKEIEFAVDFLEMNNDDPDLALEQIRGPNQESSMVKKGGPYDPNVSYFENMRR